MKIPRVISTALVLLMILFLHVNIYSQGNGNYYKVEYQPSNAAGELQLGVTYTIWIPDGVKTLCGIIVHQHGAGTSAARAGGNAAYDIHWQALAKKWDCALLGPSYHVLNEAIDTSKGGAELWFDPRRGSDKTFLKALDDLSVIASHPEIKTAPWCLWGHSGGGIWSDVMATIHPERIIAMWLRSGSAMIFKNKPEFKQPHIPEALYEIPIMVNPGQKEKGDKQYNMVWEGVLATFKMYRLHGTPIVFAPDPRTIHETGDSRYLAIPFFDACLAMRLPDKTASDNSLKQIETNKGWFADLLSNFAQPASSYKGVVRESVWLPDERFAKKWEEYVKTGEVSDNTPPEAPYDLKVESKGEKGVEITWKAEADFESGIGGFVILRDGIGIARLPLNPPRRVYGRPLFQYLSYHDTPDGPAAEMRYMDSDIKTGEKHKYSIVTINSAGLPSVPSVEASN
jgi:hypothetical protein